MSNEDFNEYDRTTYNVDELEGQDIKINPDYYLHIALVNLSKTFDGELSLKDSFIKYRHIVEHIELICEAANLLPLTYQEELDKFKKSDEFKKEDQGSQNAAIARFKMKQMLKGVFARKTITGPLLA